MKFRIHVESPDYGQMVKIVPIEERIDRTIIYVPTHAGKWEQISFNETEPIPHDLPVLTISEKWARELSEQLLNIFGPQDVPATEQKLEATERHLQDMRALVFNKEISIEVK